MTQDGRTHGQRTKQAAERRAAIVAMIDARPEGMKMAEICAAVSGTSRGARHAMELARAEGEIGCIGKAQNSRWYSTRHLPTGPEYVNGRTPKAWDDCPDLEVKQRTRPATLCLPLGRVGVSSVFDLGAE